jgi:hypothetical protein
VRLLGRESRSTSSVNESTRRGLEKAHFADTDSTIDGTPLSFSLSPSVSGYCRPKTKWRNHLCHGGIRPLGTSFISDKSLQSLRHCGNGSPCPCILICIRDRLQCKIPRCMTQESSTIQLFDQRVTALCDQRPQSQYSWQHSWMIFDAS